MVGELTTLTSKPVGVVRSEIKQGPSIQEWAEVVSDVVIDHSLTEALYGLDNFSHIIVIYWMHLVNRSQLCVKIHPMGKPELPLVGFYATRTPVRPNPIGVTVVRLLGRCGNVLTVKGLDALDGTPVIDIKPYIPSGDLVAEAKVPSWITNQ